MCFLKKYFAFISLAAFASAVTMEKPTLIQDLDGINTNGKPYHSCILDVFRRHVDDIVIDNMLLNLDGDTDEEKIESICNGLQNHEAKDMLLDLLSYHISASLDCGDINDEGNQNVNVLDDIVKYLENSGQVVYSNGKEISPTQSSDDLRQKSDGLSKPMSFDEDEDDDMSPIDEIKEKEDTSVSGTDLCSKMQKTMQMHIEGSHIDHTSSPEGGTDSEHENRKRTSNDVHPEGDGLSPAKRKNIPEYTQEESGQ